MLKNNWRLFLISYRRFGKLWNVTQSSIASENADKHDTYGISKGDIVIRDISLNKEEGHDLVKLLNMLDVSEIHARDIVEDFLGSYGLKITQFFPD